MTRHRAWRCRARAAERPRRRPGHRVRPGRSPPAAGVRQPGRRGHGCGAGKDRRERDGRRVRVVLGDPQRGQGHAYLAAGPAWLADFRDVLLGAPGFAQPHQGVQPQRAGPHQRPVRCVKQPGQPLGGLEGGQHLLVAAARQLQQRADIADRDRRRWARLPPGGCARRAAPSRPPPRAVAARSARPRALCRRCRRRARRSSRAAGPARSSAWRALPPARTELTARPRSTCGAPGR